MGIKIRRDGFKRIDSSRKVVEFDPEGWHGKITGSRLLAVLGRDKYMSEFKAACLIARLCFDDTKSVFTEAGNIIEPVMRSYVRERSDTVLRGLLNLDGQTITVEEPVDKKDCRFDHFKKDKVFGGMVDGYIGVDGRRYAILEIKTSSTRSDWFDENGGIRIPEGYDLQTSLYAELSNLEKIVFAVAFLEESDYEHPETFVPNDDNTLIVAIDKRDIKEDMEAARQWFRKYIESGVTPEWKDSDMELVDIITSDRLETMPGEVMMNFRKYINHMDSDEDLSDMEYYLAGVLEDAAIEGASSVVYKQNGVTFTLSLEGVPKLTVVRD